MNPEQNKSHQSPTADDPPVLSPSPPPTASFSEVVRPGLTTPSDSSSLDSPGPRPQRRWSDIISTVILLALAPLIALLIILFAIQSYQVDGESMQPTLQNRDRLIVDKIPRTLSRITGHAYLPHRGDIIIFNEANLPDTLAGQNKQLIKRVIGLPGDRVKVKDGKITVYNNSNPNGFNPDTTVGYHISVPTPGDHEWNISDKQIFVCGDNRPNSEDSRYFGPINANQIVGKLILRLLPLNKTQKF